MLYTHFYSFSIHHTKKNVNIDTKNVICSDYCYTFKMLYFYHLCIYKELIKSFVLQQKKLQEVIEREEREGRIIGGGGDDGSELSRQRELQQRMDIDDSDIVIQGSTTTRISRKQVSRVNPLNPFFSIIFAHLKSFSFVFFFFLFYKFIL